MSVGNKITIVIITYLNNSNKIFGLCIPTPFVMLIDSFYPCKMGILTLKTVMKKDAVSASGSNILQSLIVMCLPAHFTACPYCMGSSKNFTVCIRRGFVVRTHPCL